MNRNETKKIQVGNISIGGSNHIVIQSMCNTKTKNVNETIYQIRKLEQLGCEIIRVAVLDRIDARCIRFIKDNINIPLVADIHFDYRLALEAIENGADKIRINPGNIGSYESLKKVVLKCKEKHIPIRVGINGGSLEKDIEKQYGYNSPLGIFESAKRNVKLLEDLGFYDIVISLKSSDVLNTIEAYKLAASYFSYPLHIGITEAGSLLTSAIRSSAGLSPLLLNEIGSTLRISISDNPEYEIIVAKELLSSLGLYHNHPKLVACPTCGRTNYNMLPIVKEIEQFLLTINANITVAIMGCVVNGPSEAKNADIGIAGGKDEAILFKKGQIIKKVKQEDLVKTLKEEIMKMI
ncbi:MAG: flavodoxin-dependent (E)-4-hydroxy-3-methylbut-2-enyl-diphosphate synthase [Bacilli bacterium]|nr:flavodoxin-dependent (E)-4-hydroxy-3-methylbut-2-enyl-diphosphate synthase [Bacilli bacterium]